jgi:hypothetical protein
MIPMRTQVTLLILLAVILSTGCQELGFTPGQSEQAEPAAEAPPQASPTPELLTDQIVMSRTPTQEQALAAMRALAEQRDPSATPAVTPTPLLPRGLEPGPSGTLIAPDLGVMATSQAVGLFTYEDATTYCDGLSLAGFTDWRMPSIVELDALAESPRFPANRGQVRALWSSTTHKLGSHLRLLLPERAITHDRAVSAHVVCVR